MTTETTSTTPPPEAELEGEAPESAQVGVMYSERTWIVKPWMKALTFWLTVASIGGLAVHEVQKRRQFSGLLIDSVVEPEDWGKKPAPEVALNAVYRDGKEGGGAVKLSEFKGKWVMLNYWATWCAPCRDEMPSMEMLNRRLGKDLVMVAVSVDDDVGQIARFFGDTKPTFTVLWDNTKASARAYGTSKFPETYLIDPEGNVAAKFTGPRDWYNQGTVQYFNEVMSGKRKPVSS
jgi:cytochrome c biogenesis protein CcmG/thiol:disulfide interchange protein DsbE